MRAHHRSGALAVKVQVAYMEFAPRLFQLFARAGIQRAGQPILGVVRYLQRVVEVRARITASTGPKISSWAMRAVGATSAITVGSR